MKDITALINFARWQNWEVENTTNHIKFINTETGAFVIAPSTASDWRSLQNTVAELRRKGMDVPRKAQRKKPKQIKTGLGDQLASQLDLDLSFVRFPHIEDIMGRWRDVTWFDSDTYNPLGEDQHENVSDADMVAAIIVAPALKMNERVGDGLMLGLNSKQLIRPGDRQLFISYCIHKYWWTYGCSINGIEAPRKCACGQVFETVHMLAQHVVTQQERDRTEHEPDGLFPWSDPDQLDLLFQVRSEEQLEQLRLAHRDERDRRIAVEKELQGLKDRMKAMLNG